MPDASEQTNDQAADDVAASDPTARTRNANNPQDGMELRVEQMGRGGKGVTPRQLARALLVATLIIVVGVGVIGWPTLAPLGRQALGRAHDALFPPTPTPPVWQSVNPPFAESVAFGVSAPLTGYLCGLQGASQVATPTKTGASSATPGSNDLPIRLSVTQDGGRAWRTVTTPARGLGCAISVNPTDARDVALLAPTCVLCDSAQALTVVWRSRDGARSWAPVAPPADATHASAHSTAWPLYIGRAIWASDALYLAAFPGSNTKAQLAVCVGAAPCSWIDLNRLLIGEPSGFSATPMSIEGMKNTVYVQLFSQESCPPACIHDAISSDGGATWQSFAPTFQGQPVQPEAESHGAPDLLGYYTQPKTGQQSLLSSSDGGVSWRVRPNPPSGLYTEQILEAPDGALYAWMTLGGDVINPPSGNTARQGIYALAPNGSEWRLVAPEQANQSIAMLAFSCDTHGHAQAIWGENLSSGDAVQPVVLVHWL